MTVLGNQIHAKTVQVLGQPRNRADFRMRPKLKGPGQAAGDFVIQGPADHGDQPGHGMAGLVNLFGIESPG